MVILGSSNIPDCATIAGREVHLLLGGWGQGFPLGGMLLCLHV